MIVQCAWFVIVAFTIIYQIRENVVTTISAPTAIWWFSSVRIIIYGITSDALVYIIRKQSVFPAPLQKRCSVECRKQIKYVINKYELQVKFCGIIIFELIREKFVSIVVEVLFISVNSKFLKRIYVEGSKFRYL